jgi:hypothetical protein
MAKANDSKLLDWIPIATACKVPGKTELTPAVFDEVISTFNPKIHEPPHVFGHITAEHNAAPALGWIDGLRRIGDTLYAKSKQVAGVLDSALREGSYKKRSIALRVNEAGKLFLHHLAWLGATPPAIKGLPDVYSSSAYSDKGAEKQSEFEFEFLPTQKPNGGRHMAGTKEFSEAEITLMEQDITKRVTDSVTASLTANMEKTFSERLEKEKTEAVAAEKARLEKEFSDKNAATLRQAGHNAAMDTFINEQLKAKKVTPAMIKAGLKSLLYSLHTPAEIMFSEETDGVKKEVKTDSLAVLKNVILAFAAVPAEGDTEEPDGAHQGGDSYAEDAAAAKKIQAEKGNETLTFGEALKRVYAAKEVAKK